MDLLKVRILPQHNTTQHGVTTQKTEDGGSVDLWNVGNLPQHYMASQSRLATAVKTSKLAGSHLMLQ